MRSRTFSCARTPRCASTIAPWWLRAWLYRVAHNRCIDHLRRPVPAPAEIFDMSRGPLADPIAQAERRDDLRRLVHDVRELPEQQRSALLMREMEGLSYADLASALDVSVPAVKSLLVRARVSLVEAIEARDASCVDIRNDIAAAIDRGVRANGRVRRHVRECDGCRDYNTRMRGVQRSFNALSPGHGPFGVLAKLLGIGGAGSGAAASGTAATGGAAAVGSGAAAVTATKVAAIVCCAAITAGGAVEIGATGSTPSTHKAHHSAATSTHAATAATRAHLAAVHGVPSSTAVTTLVHNATQPVPTSAAHHGAAPAPLGHVRASAAHGTSATVASVNVTTADVDTEASGGVRAPDEDTVPTTATEPAPATDPATASTPTTAPTPPPGSDSSTASSGTTANGGTASGGATQQATGTATEPVASAASSNTGTATAAGSGTAGTATASPSPTTPAPTPPATTP